MNIVITGGASGLGAAIIDQLADWVGGRGQLISLDIKDGYDVRWPEGNEATGAAPFPALSTVDVLINCAAINRIAWFSQLKESDWRDTMDTNAYGMWRTVQHYLEQLRGGTVLNIVSNASHMPMRCSLAYNASKAAAHMITLQMARELYGSHGITVFGISPNKLAGTEMSESIDKQVCVTRGWTPEKAREYQLAGLATGQETDPLDLSEFIAFLVSRKRRHTWLHGTILPYGA